MTPLHRLRPAHYQKQALAAHYLKRTAEFLRNAEDSDAEHWVNVWTIASQRQLAGARKALEECGCRPVDWTTEVKKLRADLVPTMTLTVDQ